MRALTETVRVLLADRYMLHRTTMCHALGAHADISVVGDVGGPDATLQAVRYFKPDLLLVSTNLPLGSGFGLIRELRSVAPATQILVLTSEPTKVAASVMELGGRGVVDWSRPLTELVQDIHTAHRGEYVVPTASVSATVEHFLQARRDDTVAREILMRLTPREREILSMLVEGQDSKAIAERLVIAHGTVRSHIQHVLNKVGARTRVEAVARAIRYGLVSPAVDRREAV